MWNQCMLAYIYGEQDLAFCLEITPAIYVWNYKTYFEQRNGTKTLKRSHKSLFE